MRCKCACDVRPSSFLTMSAQTRKPHLRSHPLFDKQSLAFLAMACFGGGFRLLANALNKVGASAPQSVLLTPDELRGQSLTATLLVPEELRGQSLTGDRYNDIDAVSFMQRGVSSGPLPDDIEVSPGPQEESEATPSSDDI